MKSWSHSFRITCNKSILTNGEQRNIKAIKKKKRSLQASTRVMAVVVTLPPKKPAFAGRSRLCSWSRTATSGAWKTCSACCKKPRHSATLRSRSCSRWRKTCSVAVGMWRSVVSCWHARGLGSFDLVIMLGSYFFLLDSVDVQSGVGECKLRTEE